MGHAARLRGTRALYAPALLASLLLTLLLSIPAQAAPPTHPRTPALDLSGLNHACGVATDSKGDLYASSAGEGKVKVFNPSHALLTEISNPNTPCALAITTTGNLYVSEQATGHVIRYAPSAYPPTGSTTYTPTTIDSSGNAKGIAVDPVDNRLYVAEGTKVAVYKADGGFEANILEGKVGQATGVAAYTYVAAKPSKSPYLFLSVADSEGDEVEIFSGTSVATLKHRRTVTGVDQDRNPETPDQTFGFGPEGAYLAADPGNQNAERKCAQVASQACTAGHLYLYDAAHEALDELDATGEFVDQLTSASFADAQPTQVAVDRSGGSGDGTIYVSAGASTGAKLIAFAPLAAPSRTLATSLSHVLPKASAVATDDRGDLYAAAETTITVYNAKGEKVTSFQDAGTGNAQDLALDSKGNVYVLDGFYTEEEQKLTYYHPSSYPPTAATTYTRHEPALIEFGEGLTAIAVNPADDHVFALGASPFVFPAVIEEFDSAADGSGEVGECGAGLGLEGTPKKEIDVDGKTGEVYVSSNGGHVYAIKCGAEKEIVHEFKGGGCPSGEFGSNPAIAIDQANGHVLEYAKNQPGEGVRENETAGPCVAQYSGFGPAPEEYRLAVDNSCALHSPPLTEATTPTCKSFDPANGTAYVASDSNENAKQPYDVTALGPLSYAAPPPPTEYQLKVKLTGSGTGKVTGPGISCQPDCTESYEAGEEVTLTATAEGSSTFAGWSGACSGTAGCKVSMTEAKEVTAEFKAAAKPKYLLKVELGGTATGSVASLPIGISCGIDCTQEYDEGTAVVLTGTPGANAKAASWIGCDSVDGEGKCHVTMSSLKEVTATFDLTQHQLKVKETGSGTGEVSSSPSGITCPGTCTALFDHGTLVTLSATEDPGSEFSGWSGSGCSGKGTCEVTISEAKEVTATFEEEATEPGIPLNVIVQGSGTVTSDSGLISCNPFCEDEYEAGEEVTLTASPTASSLFVSWKHCDSGGINGRQCTLTMSQAKTVTATFATAHSLTLAKATGSGPGSINAYGLSCIANCSQATGLVKEGATVTVKATPAKHFHLASFEGDCTGTGPCEFTMGQDHEVKALFEENDRFDLKLSKTGGGQALIKTKPSGLNCSFTCSTQTVSLYGGEPIEVAWKLNKGTPQIDWGTGAGTCTGIKSTPEGTCTLTLSEDTELKPELE